MTTILLVVEVIGVSLFVSVLLFSTVAVLTSAYCSVITFINR